MDFSVLELVLFLTVENHTILVNEIQDADSPERTVEKLQKKLVLPFLNKKDKVHPRIPVQNGSSSSSISGLQALVIISSCQTTTPTFFKLYIFNWTIISIDS